MLGNRGYYTLIGSLPNLPRHFKEVDRVPISSRQLTARLRMLEDGDSRVVRALTGFLVWERQPLERTDEDVLNSLERCRKTIGNAFALSLIERVVTVRTIIVALRCRRLEKGPPPGDFEIARQIRRNWTHPDFRLGWKYPWIQEVGQMLNSDTPYRVEEMRLEIAWDNARRLFETHTSGFESVLVYLIRWEIVYRWASRDAEAGKATFERLTREALGSYAALYESGQDVVDVDHDEK